MAGNQAVISHKAEAIAAPEEVQIVNKDEILAENRLTVYMPTNQLREGEVTIEQQLCGNLLTAPRPNYFQEAEVSPAPLLTNLPTSYLQGTRRGTGFYRPRYPQSYQHSFNNRVGTSMESNEEPTAILEEGMIVYEAQEVIAYEVERHANDAKGVPTPQAAVNEVEAAHEEKVVNQEEAFAAPEGEKIENEAKLVATLEEKIGNETEAAARPGEEKIVQEAKVPTTPKKENSTQRQRDRKEQAAIREAESAEPSVVAGEIRAHKEENLNKAKAVHAAKAYHVINEVEAVAVSQEEEIFNLANVRTGKKKHKGRHRQRERDTRASPTVVLSDPRAVVASQEENIIGEEEADAVLEAAKLVNGAEAIAGSEDKRGSENQEKVVIEIEAVVASAEENVIGEDEADAALEEAKLVNGAEAIAGSEDKKGSENQEKVVIEIEAVAGPKEEKFVNQSKSDIGSKKEKCRLRQRERKRKRKREIAHKEGVPAAAREMQQKARKTYCMTYLCNSLKQVPSFIKQSIDKIFFQVASVTAGIFGYNRTPKKILKLRAKIAKKGLAPKEVGS